MSHKKKGIRVRALRAFLSSLIATSLLTLTSVGCVHHPKDLKSQVASNHAPHSTTTHWCNDLQDYKLQVGDELKVSFLYTPELDSERIVGPDGKLSLPLIGEVEAAGVSLIELREMLISEYSRQLWEPDITVNVLKYHKPQIYVGGEVNQPGAIILEGDLTLLQAVIISGGLKDTAEKRTVLLLRDSGEKKPDVITVNLSQISETAATDILLKDGDVVYVHSSFIADADKFVDQHINRIVPRFFGFSFFNEL